MALPKASIKKIFKGHVSLSFRENWAGFWYAYSPYGSLDYYGCNLMC